MRPVLLAIALCVAALPAALALPPAVAHAAAPPPRYRAPVPRPVIDPFRAPTRTYGPGNRGLEYDTRPGDPVRAIGAGVVVFSGAVARHLHVTVLHPDGLRSSYSYLRATVVAVGRRVEAGTVVGTAGERMHLGVRRGVRYIDPATLFGRRRAVLVRARGQLGRSGADRPVRPAVGGSR
jgi:murein DD-endopeptidase MepM/ murein hydrolase activator NlpD